MPTPCRVFQGKEGARPLVSSGLRAGTNRFKSQEHPRVVIKDLDGLEPDRVQASDERSASIAVVTVTVRCIAESLFCALAFDLGGCLGRQRVTRQCRTCSRKQDPFHATSTPSERCKKRCG